MTDRNMVIGHVPTAMEWEQARTGAGTGPRTAGFQKRLPLPGRSRLASGAGSPGGRQRLRGFAHPEGGPSPWLTGETGLVDKSATGAYRWQVGRGDRQSLELFEATLCDRCPGDVDTVERFRLTASIAWMWR
jgi:hypothetical protein